MKAPNGTPITGTVETIPGEAYIRFEEDGTWDYDGNGTEVGWDGQETVTRAGQTVFMDENGPEWLESQLIPDDAEPREVPAWYEDHDLRRQEIENTLTKLFERVTGGRKVDLNDRSKQGSVTMANAVRLIMLATSFGDA